MKRLLFVVGLLLAFGLGYGAMARAFPAGGVYSEAQYQGYFLGRFDNAGWEVLNVYCTGAYRYFNGLNSCNALPNYVGDASSFINFIADRLNNGAPGGSYGDPRAKTGADLIVQTMIGSSRNRYPNNAEWNTWVNLVNQYAQAGLIRWFDSSFSYSINSYYQGTDNVTNPDDDAFYDSPRSDMTIVFLHPNGTVAYAIRRGCGNPVGQGTIVPLPPLLNFKINGSTTIAANPSPVPGQTITFHHTIVNSGPSSTAPLGVVFAGNDPATGGNTTGLVNAGVMANGASSAFDENVPVPLGTAPGTTICRRVAWNPDTQGGANGFGVPVCATVQYSFTLVPSVTVLVNGQPPPAGSIAEQGDTVQFSYAVSNTGLTVSGNTNCTLYNNSFLGYHPAPAPAESTAGWNATSAGTGCPRTFPVGNTTMPAATQTIVVAASDVNKSLCRVLTVDPASFGGPPASAEVCVGVGTKPYMRVYGGDVSVGNGWPAACTQSNSSIVTWNKESPTFSGAGVQYAAYVVNRINDFATALGNVAANLGDAPSGLAFANNSTANPNIFGGSFGTVPCSQDYWSRQTQYTTTPLGSGDLTSLNGVGVYTANGPIAIHGNINPNQRSVIFVDGDVLIDGDITFPGSWNTGSMPMFQLVVRGNIYISQNVSRVDGVYIAQRVNATTGTIYTCANTALPVAAVSTASPTFVSQCNNKLTIFGSFVAGDVRFLRTLGTLSQSQTFDPAASTNIAEVFIFNPAAWMAQPPAPSGSASLYDAITSLSPVL